MQGRHRMWRRGWIAVTAVVGLASIAAGAHAAPGQSLNLMAGLSTGYDSNLLQYSDQQITKFATWDPALDPGHFAIKSISDLTYNPSLALTWELDQGNGRQHSLRLKGDGDFHDKNATADFRAASLAWRESFHGGSRFVARGYYLPGYYLRQLRDVTTTLYERAQFDLTIGEAAWTQTLNANTDLGFSYQFERRLYGPFFSERTSGTHQGELSLGFDNLPDHGIIHVLGAYRTSRADGHDDPAGSASPVPDVSYHGWWAGVDGRGEFARRKRFRIDGDIAYRFEQRAFDSNRPADRSHIGRRDSNSSIEVGLRAQFRPNWTLRVHDHYDSNQASYGGPNPFLSTDPSSYHQNQVGLELSWTGDLWRQARPDAGSGDTGGN